MGAKVKLLAISVVAFLLVILGACAFAPFILSGRASEQERKR